MGFIMSDVAAQRAASIHGFWRMLAGFIAVWVICVVVWGLTGQGYFWPMWPALGFVIGTIYAGIRIFSMPKK